MSSIEAVTPYLHGQLLLQNGDYHSIPFSMGIEPTVDNRVLQVNTFLQGGAKKMNSHDAEDVTPVPTIESLEDEVVFVSSQVASRLGVRPPTVIRFYDSNKSNHSSSGQIIVSRLDPFVESGEWEVFFKNAQEFVIRSMNSEEQFMGSISDGPIDLGLGMPVFEAVPGSRPFQKGDHFKFHVFRGSTIEVFAPSMIEKANADEMMPPREVRIGGIFEVAWQGFHTEALISTMRFMQDMRGQEGRIDGFYLKALQSVARSEADLAQCCMDLEEFLGEGWGVVPWFVENAWFFDLLKFEEYLMILIMVPHWFGCSLLRLLLH
jgi:ABC-type lipoprotein release transport system permease subunit